MQEEQEEDSRNAREKVLENPKLLVQILRQGPRKDKGFDDPLVCASFLFVTFDVNQAFRTASIKVMNESLVARKYDDKAELEDRLDSIANYSLSGTPSLREWNMLQNSKELKRVCLQTDHWCKGLCFSESITHLDITLTEGDLNFSGLVLPPSLVWLKIVLWSGSIVVPKQLKAPDTLVDLMLIAKEALYLDDDGSMSYDDVAIPNSVRHLSINLGLLHVFLVPVDLKRLQLCVFTGDRDDRASSTIYLRPKIPANLEYISAIANKYTNDGTCRMEPYDDILLVNLPVFTDDASIQRLCSIREIRQVMFEDAGWNDTPGNDITLIPPNITRLCVPDGNWPIVQMFLRSYAHLVHIDITVNKKSRAEFIDLRDFPRIRSVRLKGNFGGQLWLNEGLELLDLIGVKRPLVIKPNLLPSTLKEFSAQPSFVPRKERFPDSLEYLAFCATKMNTIDFQDMPPKLRHLVLYNYLTVCPKPLWPTLKGSCPSMLDYLEVPMCLNRRWILSPENPNLCVTTITK